MLRTEVEWVRPLVVGADAHLSDSTTKILKHGASTTSGIVETMNFANVPEDAALLPAGAAQVFLKRYNRTGIAESVKTLDDIASSFAGEQE